MLESVFLAPLHFTVEFLGFLVAAGGAVLVASRPVPVGASVFSRTATALGLAALAAAQVVHGGLFEIGDADGDRLLVILRTAGYVLAALGIAPAGRPSSAVAVAGLEAKQPFLFAPAGAALALSAAAFRASRYVPGAARLGVGALALAASEVLTALAPATGFGQTADAYTYGAHAAKLVGFMALGSWLWTSTKSSLRTRFVAVFAGLLVVVVLALSTALTGVISNNITESQLDGIGGQLNTARANISEQVDDLAVQAGQIADLPDLETRIAGRGDADALVRDIRATLSEFYLFDFVALLGPSGELRASSEDGPRLEGPGRASRLSGLDVLGMLGSPVVAKDLLRGERTAASVDVVPDSNIVAVIAGAPVHSGRSNRVVGYLVIARYLDAITVRDIARLSRPAEASLVVGDRVLATTLPRGVTATDLLSRSTRRELQAGGRVRSRLELSGESYFTALAPLVDARGVPTNATLALSAPSFVVTDTRDDVIRVLFLVALGIGLVVLALALLSGRRITRPIRQLTATASAVREGNLEARAPVGGSDEVGRLGRAFNEMTASLRSMTDDLKTAAREEHDLRERIETIIQSMADGLVAVDKERRILAFNSEAEVMTGVDAKDAVGKKVEDVLAVIDAQDNDVRLPLADLTEGSLGGVFLLRERREPVPIAVTTAVLRDEGGEVAGAVAVLRDMTRERELERMKSEFLSNISHELRTPLTPIKGYADILAKRDLSPDQTRKFADGIAASTERLERIVGLLVDFAAMEAGRLAPGSTPIDVAGMLDQLAGEWATRTPRHEFICNVGSDLPAAIGDERLIKRSLEEVLDNAVKFSPRGGKITLTARGISPNGRRPSVEVEIGDEGIGIAPQDLAHVFSDFHQLDGSETRTYGGLGLGLAFVRRIVEAHAGEVGVVSEPEVGTKLTITLPASAPRVSHEQSER